MFERLAAEGEQPASSQQASAASELVSQPPDELRPAHLLGLSARQSLLAVFLFLFLL